MTLHYAMCLKLPIVSRQTEPQERDDESKNCKHVPSQIKRG